MNPTVLPNLFRLVRWLPVCALVLALSSAAYAQQPDETGPPMREGGRPPGPPSPAQELTRLDHALTLTDAQKTSILPILEKRRADMSALTQGSSDREVSRGQMRTLMQSSNTQIRALLTESQQKTFDTMRPGRGPRPGQDGGGPGGDGPGGGGPPPPPPDGAAPPTKF